MWHVLDWCMSVCILKESRFPLTFPRHVKSHPHQKKPTPGTTFRTSTPNPELPTCPRDLNTNGKILQEIWSSVPKGGEWIEGKVTYVADPEVDVSSWTASEVTKEFVETLTLSICKSWETHAQCLFSQFCHLNSRKQSRALWKGPWRRDVAMWNIHAAKPRSIWTTTWDCPLPQNAVIRRWWTWILTALWNWCCSIVASILIR